MRTRAAFSKEARERSTRFAEFISSSERSGRRCAVPGAQRPRSLLSLPDSRSLLEQGSAREPPGGGLLMALPDAKPAGEVTNRAEPKERQRGGARRRQTRSSRDARGSRNRRAARPLSVDEELPLRNRILVRRSSRRPRARTARRTSRRAADCAGRRKHDLRLDARGV